MTLREARCGMPMAKVTNHLCNLGLMKKEPAPGFMQATTCVLLMDLTCAGPTRGRPGDHEDGVEAAWSHEDASAATASTAWRAIALSLPCRDDGPDAARNGPNLDQRPPIAFSDEDDARRWRKVHFPRRVGTGFCANLVMS